MYSGDIFPLSNNNYRIGSSSNRFIPDLIATIIGSVQANILSIRLVESEQERMRKELEHAKSEINRLKGLVASLQN